MSEVPGPVLEAQKDITVDGTKVRASVRVDDSLVLAGGPLTVVWQLRAFDGRTVYVALGGNRVSGRLAGVSFGAELHGTDVVFTDPAEGAVDLGGPVGVQTVSSTGLTVAVLVNQFLTLERARPAVLAGAEGLLVLQCRWDLEIAPRRDEVLGAAPRSVKLSVRVPLRRDDASLGAIVRDLATAVLKADRQDEDALSRLVALRHPDTTAIVAEIGGDAERLAWVRAALEPGG